jgi:uncharacterized protein with PQ loop repeat
MSKTLSKNIRNPHLEKVTTIVGLIGHIATYIQVFKIFYLQSSYAVSFIATIISFTSMIFWLLYGIEKHDKPLIICNCFGLVGVFMIIVGILIYGKNYF